MEEKYKTLSLVQLREIVKAQGIKNTSVMRKAQLVQILCELEEKLNREKAAQEEKAESERGITEKETVQKETVQKEAAQKETNQKEAVQKEAVQKEGAQKEAPRKKIVRKETAQKETAQKEAVQSETVQKASVQRETVRKKAVQKKVSHRKTVQKETSDIEMTDNKETVRGAADKRAADKEAIDKEAIDKGATDKGATDKGAVKREAVQRENIRREVVLRETAPKETPEKEAAGKNTDRAEQRTETREDQRSEQKTEQRADQKSEQRTDQRSEQRTEQRADQRSEQRTEQRADQRSEQRTEQKAEPRTDRVEKRQSLDELDSGQMADGILEVMPDGFGFIRCENYLPGDNDIYVSPAQIRRFNLKTGDIIEGNIKIKTATEKFSALLYVKKVNGFLPAEAARRKNFEDMTPVFPNSRIRLENPRATVPMRIVDLVSPIGKGQRGMIVSPPKTGKTTLLKQIAKSISYNHPDMNMIILLIDERPEEVTDIKEYIEGENVEVIYSTFDELPEHHKRVSEMVLERAKRLVEHKKDVVILLDSITRLARAYNLTVPPSGRTLSGGLDPAALYMPKRFFGAARNMREGGSLTVLATALVETGSRMDDVVFEEFKGTGNMELVLDRKLSEKRIFPAIDIPKSGTRREELLLDREEMDAMYMMRKALNGMKSDEALEHILDMFMRTRSNREFIANIKRTKII